MPAPILAGIGAAGIAAAVGKGAATVGLSAAGGVASYYIVDAARAKHDPMIGHAILTTATQTDSDSLVAVNFSGAESGLVLVAVLIVVFMILYKCKNCLCLKMLWEGKENHTEGDGTPGLDKLGPGGEFLGTKHPTQNIGGPGRNEDSHRPRKKDSSHRYN